MMKKIAVTLQPYTPARYPYQKLEVCRKCDHFTVLGDTVCTHCGKSTLQPVEKRAAVTVQKNYGKRDFSFFCSLELEFPLVLLL